MRLIRTIVLFVVVVAFHVAVIGTAIVLQGCGTPRTVNLPPANVLPGGEDVGIVRTRTYDPPTRVTPLPPPRPGPIQDSGKVHVVKKGETLSEIALRYKMSWKDLMRFNGLTKADWIVEGQTLRLPGHVSMVAVDAPDASVDSLSPPAPAVTLAGGSSYTVRNGDSLWKIARKAGVSVGTLRSANQLKTDVLQIGQKLVIPGGGAPAGVVADAPVVDADDSQDTPAAAVPDDIVPVVDGPVVTDAPDDDAGAGGTDDPREVIHTVVADEDLITIAIRHNVTSTDIMKLNGLTSRKVQVGQRLRIPVRD